MTQMIGENLKSVRQRIARCCEKALRPPGDVLLVCVTKEAGPAEMEEVLRLGITDLGENRVQELAGKYIAIGDRAIWHLVGHLQTNKAKDAVSMASLIHSVDSVRLAEEIDKHAGRIGKIQDILLQVNTSGEKAKFGVSPDEAIDIFKKISTYQNINIKGLMTIAPESKNPEGSRPYFRRLRELRDELNTLHPTPYTVRILSMGMTDDFEIAIEEGSNMVRIGRGIFGAKRV